MNDFVAGETPLDILQIEPRVEQEQIARVQHLRQVRDNALLRQRLAVLESVAKSDENIMPAIVDAVRAYVSIGEVATDVLRGGIRTRRRGKLRFVLKSNGRAPLWPPPSRGRACGV